MAKLWGERGVWLILHIFLLLPVSGRTSTTRYAENPSEQIRVVNLTSGVRTTIDFPLASDDPSYTCDSVCSDWRIEAPPGLRVLLTVSRHLVSNIIEATDEDDSGNSYIFSANSFAEDGDYFLSSSEVVYMKATLKGPAPNRQFTVIGEVVNITNTIDVTGDPLDCRVTSNDRINHWDKTECENDMVSFNDSCYHFISQGTDLDTARMECEEMSGFHLVFIDSSEEQDFLAMASASNDINANCNPPDNCDYWIGIEENGDRKPACWMDGSAIIYNNFKKPEPSGECFRLKSEEGYVWESHNCGHNHHGYICEREQECIENTAEFHTFGGSCYYFKSARTDLNTAKTGCEAMSGFHLVFIDSSEEQEFLACMSEAINSQCLEDHDCDYWIGIASDNDELIWMDGSAISYENFKMFDISEECFRLKSEEGYVWESHDCSHDHYGYICEREQGYHGTTPDDRGCASFEATLPVLTDNDDGILLKFSYYIKTFDDSDNSGTVMLWTGTYIISCKPSDAQSVSQGGLRMEISCIKVSPYSLEVKFQASGEGLVKIGDMQLFIVSGTTAPLTTGPVPSSTTLVSTTSPTTSPIEPMTVASTGSVGTAFSSSSPPATTSPPSSFSMSTMTMSPTTRTSTPSLDTHSSSPPIITTESSKSQDRSSGMKKSVIPIVVVLLIVLLIALVVGVFWYKRRGKLATSKRNQQSRSSNGTVQNPTFENDVNEHEYAEYSEKPSTKGTIRTSSSEDAQQHIYTDLPASASKDNNGVIYNEVGEQDYNVPFGGKEMGDYHEYNLPDSDHGRSNAKKPTNEDSYQELSEDGKRCSPKGIESQALPGMTAKAIESQPKVGDPTGGHAYQDLRKDDGGYTSLQNSLGLPQKPVTKVTAAELENSYQALHADGPDYFTLETNETKPSPNPDNLQNSTYQPLRQEPEYAILESEQSDNPAKPEDNTYQSLLKDANNHADSDTEHRKDNTPKEGQSDPYDVLQRGLKTKQLSLDGYGSLGPTAKEEEEHDYESPEGNPQATTDYEDPIQDNRVADGPYDSLQRKTMPEPPRSSPSLANRAVDDGDDDDYETPDRSNDDPTDANYQTLDNRQEKSDSGNAEYSHLQRSLGANLSHVPTVVSDNSNQYGKLNYGNSAAK